VSISAKDLAVRMGRSVPTLRLPDLLRNDLDVVFCGINPALNSARAGHHFSSPSNRFWGVLHLAGFTPHLIRPENDRTILNYGCGLTTAVERPTVSASELKSYEFHQAAEELERKLLHYVPRNVAFLGKPAFAAIFGKGRVEWGQQFIRFGGAEVWVLPNPSGLNRAFRLGELVSAYQDLRTASRPISLDSHKVDRFFISPTAPSDR
jgi:double-stranded uracil-DNA glycosylase